MVAVVRLVLVFLAAVLVVEARLVVVFLVVFGFSSSVVSEAAFLLLVLVAFVDLLDFPDFLLLAFAASAANAVSSVISSTVWPSGREAFTLPCLIYGPYGPS